MRADRPAGWAAATQSLKKSRQADFLLPMIASLAVIAMLLADEGEQVRAVELLSLALNHPASPRGWLENWPLLTRKCEQLESQLDSGKFNAAWEQGARLDLHKVVAQLLEEFSAADS
jgi:hypothetical protein